MPERWEICTVYPMRSGGFVVSWTNYPGIYPVWNFPDQPGLDRYMGAVRKQPIFPYLEDMLV